METIKLTRARAHAGLAAMLLGSVAWSGGALAQNVSNTTPNAVTSSTTNTNAATPDGATTNAVTVNAAARGQNNNSGSASSRSGATDPGVRGGDPGVGGALPGLNDVERQYFDVAKEVFQEVDAGPDGLGPRFNLDSCSGCHSQPTIGGTSPATNPQVAVATLMGAKNVVPPFVTANGPIREARFVRNRDGSPDGGVHSLFVITGRSDAAGCNIAQPNFAAELARNNVVFRIPTPVFGLGLVENVSDGTLEAALAANAQQKRALGISGTFNHNGNDGTISRFGWKAQNKSLLMFAGEAYNVEMGISNELFTQDRPLPGEDHFGRGLPGNCLNLALVGYPEDITHSDGTSASSVTSDTALFTVFMQFLDQPTPSTSSPGGATSIANGRRLFSAIGCAICHTPSLTTQTSHLTSGLSNAAANLFSDIEIHHMGVGLADNVSQGDAGGDQFRTSPLWGLGQRIFLLHDGRTTNLLNAIEAHDSRGSEANVVESNFDSLSSSQQQDLLNFLRSL